MTTADQAPAGKIETLRFARLLARFWEQGFTGSFRARATVRPDLAVTKEILLERGRVAWAASDDPEESIRVHLFNRGLVTAEQWRLAEEKSGSAQVRQTLLDLGFLTARELLEVDRERVTALILGLFGWRDGLYETAPGPIPHNTPNLKIDPRDLVLEGLMSSGDRGRVLDEIGSLDTVLVVRPDDLLRASLSLPVELAGLMGKADGTRTIADICALSALPDFLISAAFAALKVLGLARPVEGPLAAAPPAPAIEGLERAASRMRRMASREAGPKLPLEEPAPFETVPMAATPPRGLAAAAARKDGAHPPAELRETAASIERHLEAEAIPPDDEPTIQIEPREDVPALTREPPESPAVAAAEVEAPVDPHEPIAIEAHGETFESDLESLDSIESGEAEDAGREGEVELKPGIRVLPERPSLAHTGTEVIEEEEIEDAIQVLDEPDRPPVPQAPPAPAVAVAAAITRAAPRDAEPSPEAGTESEKETDVEESAAGDEEEEGPNGHLVGGEPAPAWIYEPSAAAPAEARSPARRYAAWGGIGLAFIGLAAALALMFGGDRGAAEPEAAAPVAATIPQDVLAPAAFSADRTPPPPARDLSSSAIDEPPSRPAAGRSSGSSAPRGEPKRAAESAPVTSRPSRPAPLASSRPGSILPSGSFQEGRRLLASGDLDGAARSFQSGLSANKGLYTVQLAIACEPRTVSRALESTGGSTQFFILPAAIKGKACYRMLWGIYPGSEPASKARTTAPPVFLRDRNPPRVAPI